MKLITHLFDGDKKRLRGFTENVDMAFELVDPDKHDNLLKCVKTKITGDARSKLIVRDLTHAWALVRGIWEENYAVRRTLDFYACRMFSARQEKGENVASWGSRIDEMQTELREAAWRVCRPEEILGAIELIGHLGKACFVHLARDCRQKSKREPCEPRFHVEQRRPGTTSGTREQGSSTEAACGVQRRNWIRVGNELQGPKRN